MKIALIWSLPKLSKHQPHHRWHTDRAYPSPNARASRKVSQLRPDGSETFPRQWRTNPSSYARTTIFNRVLTSSFVMIEETWLLTVDSRT